MNYVTTTKRYRFNSLKVLVFSGEPFVSLYRRASEFDIPGYLNQEMKPALG